MSVDLNRYNTRIREILGLADLDTTSAKAVRRQLEVEYSVDLTEHKQEVDKRILQILNEIDLSNQTLARKLQREEQSASRRPSRRGTTTASTAKSSKSTTKRAAPKNSPFTRPLVLSPALSALMGETHLARFEVVKRMWAIIKDRGLQDPADGRYIRIMDEDMRQIFGKTKARVQMFSMNKVLSKHMMKPEEVVGHDLPFEGVVEQIDDEEVGEDPPKRAAATRKAAPKRKRVAETNADGTPKKRKNNPLDQLQILSPILSSILKKPECSRPQVVKGIWDYIKERDLQDPANRKFILCDGPLQELFGTDRVSGFGMNSVNIRSFPKHTDILTIPYQSRF
ncbi:SWIB/MDM2 domain-containing protein [Phlyctochytrium arcticum]|nr:SWIB/MDM2 domain-containing protein [Phlyctochytrium arcticum]